MRERLVVVGAMGIETRALRVGLPGAAVTTCGIGPQAALAAGWRLAEARGRDDGAAIVMSGFAGALTTALQPGQVIVANTVSDGNTTFTLSSAPVLAAQLRREGLDVVVGPLVSAPAIVRGPQRHALTERTGAVAVDTESFWFVSQLLHGDGRRRDPSVSVVRVIVDTPAHELWSAGTLSRGVRAARVMRQIGPPLAAWSEALAPRSVILAGPRSFCAGVERAIDIVQRAIDRFGAPVYVRRQIVHNTHVVQDLEAVGAIFVRELDEVPDGATVVIAAHGVAPAVHDEAAARHLHVVDATCPLVAKVHTEARRYGRDGYCIVLVGHEDHEEVVGTRGEAPEHIVVVDDADDVERLDVPDPTRVAYLTQTTLAVDDTASVIAAVRARFPNAVGPRTSDICYATQNRQEALRAIAPECDLVLVVGSKNSSNSNRLVEVARRAGCPAQLIENESDIDLRWLAAAHTVGVSAGASAPEQLVTRVVDALGALGPLDVIERDVLVEDVRFTLPAEVR